MYIHYIIKITLTHLNSYFRVALTPAVAATLIKKGFNVHVEENAGVEAMFRNEDYEKAGAKLVDMKGVFNTGM